MLTSNLAPVLEEGDNWPVLKWIRRAQLNQLMGPCLSVYTNYESLNGPHCPPGQVPIDQLEWSPSSGVVCSHWAIGDWLVCQCASVSNNL